MEILIAALLFLCSCGSTRDLGACTEEILPITDSGPAFRGVPKKDVISAINTGPSSKQTKKEWESYLENIGKIRIDLTLEGFKVRPIFVQGNTAFSVIYQFHLGEDYHPTHIYLVQGERQIDAEAAKACLAKWTLSGLLPNKKYLLVLNWEHIKGYTTLTLIGDQISLMVRLQTPI